MKLSKGTIHANTSPPYKYLSKNFFREPYQNFNKHLQVGGIHQSKLALHSRDLVWGKKHVRNSVNFSSNLFQYCCLYEQRQRQWKQESITLMKYKIIMVHMYNSILSNICCWSIQTQAGLAQLCIGCFTESTSHDHLQMRNSSPSSSNY